MEKGKIFIKGKSQAVRLPKKYRFSSEEVLIQDHPAGRLLIDPKRRWELLNSAIDKMEDFYSEGRKDLPVQERELNE